MTTPNNRYRAAVWQASDRFFVDPCDLCPDLDADPHGTLHRLSATPEAFGTIKPAHTASRRKDLHQQLVAAAKAYVVRHLKPNT